MKGPVVPQTAPPRKTRAKPPVCDVPGRLCLSALGASLASMSCMAVPFVRDVSFGRPSKRPCEG